MFSRTLEYIVLDECHKALDRRSGFRDAYPRLSEFMRSHRVPILACSATLNRKWLRDLNGTFFSGQARCILDPIIRKHVQTSIKNYAKCKNQGESGYNWETAASMLAESLIDNITIIFVDFQNDAKQISELLNEKKIPSNFIVGGHMSAEEKREASDAFKEGKVRVLVATETYECGMHNANCTQVIRIGCPRNLSVMVQEMGRTGRNNENGVFSVHYNEFFDDQRLANWVKSNSTFRCSIDRSDPEIIGIINDYGTMWRYLYSPLIGMCSHLALSLFFDDPSDDPSEAEIGPMQVAGCRLPMLYLFWSRIQ